MMASVLEMAVLGLLRDQDMHGYELKKRLADVFGVSSAVSFGSLYPALARLEAAGAVRVLAAPEAGAAPAGPAAPKESRRRKVYAITPRGAEMFVELLTHAEGGMEDEKSFNVRLAFARYLPPEGRLGLLERRRAVLGEHLALLAARARAKREDRYVRILLERQRDELARDMTWLGQLIDEEKAGAGTLAPSGAPPPGSQARDDQASELLAPVIVAPHMGPPSSRVAPEDVPRSLHERGPQRLVPLASASQLMRPRPIPGPAMDAQPEPGDSTPRPTS